MMNKNDRYNVLVIGATGLVGRTIIDVLHERKFPVGELTASASAASAGTFVSFGNENIPVHEFTPSLFKSNDVVFFAGKDGLSREFCPKAVEEGCWVIDNSADFRLESGVPLVVPEVNADILPETPCLIANPNCTTIQIVMALAPLEKAFGVERVIVSSYQAISGAGQKPLDEMLDSSLEILDGEKIDPCGIAFNLLPAIGSLGQGGYFSEETKVKHEIKKILNRPDMSVAAMCIRVPTMVGHGTALFIELAKGAPLDHVWEVLTRGESLVVYPDGPEPTVAHCAGNDDVHVGRIHLEGALRNGLVLWVMGDNLRVGAATNAIRIAEALIRRGAL